VTTIAAAGGKSGGKKQGKENSPCQFQHIARWGACRKTRVRAQNHRPLPQPAKMGGYDVRVLLSTNGYAVTSQ
jgi:hypothetical protein